MSNLAVNAPLTTLHRVDVSHIVELEGVVELAVETFLPGDEPRAILFCLPGGGCNRHYFDLQVEGDPSYSFARAMARRGYLVLTVDHLGVGDSTRPVDGLEVTLERLIAANHEVVTQLRAYYGLHLPAIAVAHSMGALLAVLQQHSHQSFGALCLLGFGSCGMPDYLCDYGHGLIGDSERAFRQSVELARQQFGTGYIDITLGEENPRGAVAPAAYAALARARGPLITVPGAFSLVPDCALTQTRRLDVPVYVAAGDRDIVNPAREAPTQFANSVSLDVLQLPDTGHMHFVYASRSLLQQELHNWCEKVISGLAGISDVSIIDHQTCRSRSNSSGAGRPLNAVPYQRTNNEHMQHAGDRNEQSH